MAMREYVGARYVPRFLGAYDPTQIYDALDVVDNGAGTSYIARKTVPAGTALTNTEYWFVYGASSGAILDIYDQLDQLRSDRMLEMKDRVFFFMSDSYDTMTSYCDAVGTYIGCKSFTKRSYGGARFYATPGSENEPKQYYNILTTLDPLTDAEKASITDVAFCVAVNDVSAGAELVLEMTKVNTYLRTNIPNLRNIYLLPVGWNTYTEAKQLLMRNVMNTYAIQAGILGWHYIDCTRVMRTAAFIDSSDTSAMHPTATGGDHIAYCVADAILSGSCSYQIDGTGLYYKYIVAFSANMGTPNVDTGGGKVGFEGYLESDGTIRLLENTDPQISNVTIPTGTNELVITMAADTTNMNPFPIRTTQKYSIITGNISYINTAWMDSNNQGKLKIHIITKNDSGVALTATLRLRFPQILIR